MIQQETKNDPELRKVENYILFGWPSNRNKCHKLALPFFNFRDELTISDGIILKGEVIIIPSIMRKEILH